MSRSSGFGFMLLLATLGGCAAQPPAVVVDSSAKTFDGLYPVENVSVTGAWARPDIDLTGYERILLEGAGIQFRPVPAAERLGGSASGTVPGLALPGRSVVAPLNPDPFTFLILAQANTPAFRDFLGRLDGAGRATASLNVGPLPPSIWGFALHFAYVLYTPSLDFASNAVAVRFMP